MASGLGQVSQNFCDALVNSLEFALENLNIKLKARDVRFYSLDGFLDIADPGLKNYQPLFHTNWSAFHAR